MTTDLIHNLRKAQRTDPLTRVAARYPHESALPADYAKSIEGPDNAWWHDDILYKITVVICSLSVLGVIGIVVVELLLRGTP